MKKILIVEDDFELNNGILLALKGQGYECIQCDCIEEAKKRLPEMDISLILLDINLPDGSGLDWLVEVRKQSAVPVILISANNMEMDVVVGLEMGANDYITKPFSLMVLRARVSVQLREKTIEHDEIIQVDDFCFDFKKMEFKVKDRSIVLSRTEQKLLRKLVENQNIVLSRSQLIDELWSGESEYVEEHALTVVMKRLRQKLGDNEGNCSYIKTIYGVGYEWLKEERK